MDESAMAEQVGIELEGATARKRQEATGSQRLSTLWKNKKVLFIALLASFGGLEYGYQQGVLSQCYVMWSFKNEFSAIVNDSSKQGWLTSILQLGGWLGALSSGVFAQVFTRKHTMFVGCLWVILGSYLCAGAQSSAYLYAGRWFTGLGVGTFSAVGPLYNAELAPPEMRGIIVACQQLATTLGIMTSYWIGYGTNYIGGTGSGQSDMAWRLPSIIQGLPAIFLSVCIWFMPFSPRLLMHKGKEAEVLKTLSYLRNLPEDHELVQLEFMEIKSEALFEERHFKKAFPKLAERSGNNLWMREFAQYVNCVNSWDNFKRIFIGGAVMFFQQWSGIDSIIYYASTIFESLGMTSGTISLLATGVVGIINVVMTIPAMIFIDKVGRKPLLIAGSIGMMCCMLIVGIIVAKFRHDWEDHGAAGWAAATFIWLYIANFAYSWGPASWILISEIFPLSIRAKGTSISASSNWMNNFVIAFIVPALLKKISWGTYVFFACFLLLSVFFIAFVVPETKNRTLEEMDKVFGSRAGVEDAEDLAQAQRDAGLTAYYARKLAGEQQRVAESEKPHVEEANEIEGKASTTTHEEVVQ